MRLVTFRPGTGANPVAGWLDEDGEHVVDAGAAQGWLARERRHRTAATLGPSMESLVVALDALAEVRQALGGERPTGVVYALDRVRLLAPLPRPRTVRDFYAFEAHVKTARGRRGLEMIPEWYAMPVFYFSNPNAVYGPDESIPYPAATRALDYELEVAAVVGRQGRNIPAGEADEYIAGFTIMNDWSARDVQREEMKVGLGPAKGKDFATSLGPWLVTRDELAGGTSPATPGTGRHYRLAMSASIDGRQRSQGNLGDLYWTFAQMVAYASRDCTLYPGEVLGSGTVGTGCLLELGQPWLEPGQTVTLEVERLGTLENTISKE